MDSDKLGLAPVKESPGGQGYWYETGGAKFLVYPSEFAGTNRATAASFQVPNFDAVVGWLRGRGVAFEDLELGEFKTESGVLTLPDGGKAAWFKDSEGNTLAISSEDI
jgi:hypothetical protein